MRPTMSTEPAAELDAEAPSAPAHQRRRRRRRWIIAVVSAAVVLAGAGGAIWWYLRDDAPAAVDLQSATRSVDGGAEAGSADTAVDVNGSWAVDTSIGDFSYEDSTGTFVGFRVEEELAGIGSTTAVGRSPDVTGTIVLEGTALTAATIEVDMTAITTDDSRRDNQVQNALETYRYPSATFVLTEPIELGDSATNGEAVTVTAVGDLTIHGKTARVRIPLEVELVDNTIVVVGTMDVTFSDYDVSVPRAAIVLSVADEGVIELQLFFTKK
jgi:polyisoprenoid-binding protein YceI